MGRQKKHAVILRTPSLAHCAEGLRCAVGLTLVGDRVLVFFTGAAKGFVFSTNLGIVRPIQTLSRLGHELYLDAEVSANDEVLHFHDEIEPTDQMSSLIQSCDTSAVW
jgi:hypothetical protein